MTVLDASIVLKWFIQESDSPIALHFKERLLTGREKIIVPDILVYEVPNVLRFKHDVSEQWVKFAIQDLMEIGLEIIEPTPKLIEEAIHISFATDLSIYDSVYISLANELETVLITADKRIKVQADPFCKIQTLDKI